MTGGLDLGKRRRVAEALVEWFGSAARDLPWRRERSGYAALVSEAMLQQTQVSRVVERFVEFVTRFPDVRALAAADEQDVLALWQGLGYYRRARSLHAAAKRVVDEFDGVVPSTVEELLTLPGVGKYTAGAIASIAFGVPAPIVDGNVQRVLARIAGRDAASDSRESIDWTWSEAQALVEQAEMPGVFNEAMMELGATVCTPRAASCDACPVMRSCVAHRTGRVDEIPPPKTRPQRTVVHHHAVAVRRGEAFLFEQRPAEGLWARLWQMPTIECDAPLDADAVGAKLDVSVTSIEPAGVFEFGTTHRRITFHIHLARSRARRGTWRSLDDLDDLPMGRAQKRVVEYVGSLA